MLLYLENNQNSDAVFLSSLLIVVGWATNYAADADGLRVAGGAGLIRFVNEV